MLKLCVAVVVNDRFYVCGWEQTQLTSIPIMGNKEIAITSGLFFFFDVMFRCLAGRRGNIPFKVSSRPGMSANVWTWWRLTGPSPAVCQPNGTRRLIPLSHLTPAVRSKKSKRVSDAGDECSFQLPGMFAGLLTYAGDASPRLRGLSGR